MRTPIVALVLGAVALALGSLPVDAATAFFGDLRGISFRAGKAARRPRTGDVPQLECGDVGGSCPEGLDKVRCVRDADSVAWTCTADGFDIDHAHIACEGATGPGDSEYVKGSCSLTCDAEPTSSGLANLLWLLFAPSALFDLHWEVVVACAAILFALLWRA